MRFQKLANLKGLVSEAVGLRLAGLAMDVTHDQAIVELGSFQGRSTCFLAEGSRLGHHAHVWAIDPWNLPGNETGKHGFAEPTTLQKFKENVDFLELNDLISAWQGFSTDCAEGWDGLPIGLLFIDGSHTYEDVKADYEAWTPHLAPGATVVFDDYMTKKNPGVTQFVDELKLHLDIGTPPLAICRP